LEKIGRQIKDEQEHTVALRDQYKQLSTNPDDYRECSSNSIQGGWGFVVKDGFSKDTWVPRRPGDMPS